ncbi:MAG: hypothetical protein JRG68_04410 [Deltaproteobacteria bacterium]|nr:hypothetical protein [Deltaproteobacteria bacterium]MBW2099997.1 hypothetical protein [Deltaproteobacteria bacterium]
MSVICNFSKPSEGDLKEIQALEKELGKTLVAFACPDRKVTGLSEDQLKKIQDLEKKLGVVLMALG